jgi:hypothetical protein
MPLKRIILCLFAAGACGNNKVLTSKDISLGRGTYSYLKTLYAAEDNDADFLNALRNDLAKYALAKKQGMQKDRAFDRYYIPRKNSRGLKSANYLRHKAGKEELGFTNLVQSENLVFRAEEIVPMLKKFAGDKSRLPRQVIGRLENKILYYEDLQKTMLPEEESQLSGFPDGVLKTFLAQRMLFVVAASLDQKLQAQFSADADEIDFCDRASVADKFLAAKYARRSEGVYAVSPADTQFPLPQMYDHFFKIRSRLQSPLAVEYRILHRGKTYRGSLIRTLQSEFAVKQVEHSHDWLPEIIIAIKTGEHNTTVQSGDDTMQLEVVGIHYANGPVRFEDHFERVRLDMQREILGRQLPVDIADTIKDRNIRTFLPL